MQCMLSLLVRRGDWQLHSASRPSSMALKGPAVVQGTWLGAFVMPLDWGMPWQVGSLLLQLLDLALMVPWPLCRSGPSAAAVEHWGACSCPQCTMQSFEADVHTGPHHH